MKTQYFFLSFLFILAAMCTAKAQKGTVAALKKETIKVWGECGMCRKKIETAATTAGAATASWNENNKMLTVTFSASKTSAVKMQEAIAAAGYDTKDLTASDEAYSKLPGCCQYQRKETAKQAAAGCCNHATTACSKDQACCKDATCDADKTACKDKGCCKS